MPSGIVVVPAAILLDPQLSLNARLVWICLQAEGHAPAQLTPRLVKANCGLTRPTIRRALRELLEAGLLSQSDQPAARQHVLLHTDILMDERLGPWEILLYGVLQLTDGFHDNGGQFTYNEIQSIAGASIKPLRRAVRRLQATGWLWVARGKKFRPIRFDLRNPEAERCQRTIVAIGERLKETKHYGEQVMREYLSLLIDSDEYQDNARPGFLVNPYTEEIMEFDRYYTKGVAWEYNGPQHDGPTARYPNTAKARRQQGRDMIKRSICADKGIHLIIVHAEDLTLATMRAKIGNLLPLRDLSREQMLIDYLGTLNAESKK
jgi:hypothetical protein